MASSICTENQHKLHHAHQLYLARKSLREIEIPPRKLLNRRINTDMFLDSPKLAEDAVFSKFLPYNTGVDEDDDPYSSDHFRMFEFKVRKCNRSRSHDWTDCPFAHPGEKARRRDPRKYHYSGTVCAEFRKGHCTKGDNCEYSHGVFECWLHPDRYRTEACKDGKNCKRKICFFAHTTRQLRYLPDDNSPMENKYHPNLGQCCVFCHASPTSTLMGMPRVSPPTSPPISPYLVNQEKLSDLMEAMNMNGATSDPSLMMSHAPVNVSRPWVDVNFTTVDEQHQPQFVMSPSAARTSPGGSSTMMFRGRNLMEDSRYNNAGESAVSGPDLGWVNDLLSA